MTKQVEQIEQEAQQLICRGEDLLDRTHEIAQEILDRVSHAMQGDAPLGSTQERNESESAA